jgi:hypothetical protein
MSNLTIPGVQRHPSTLQQKNVMNGLPELYADLVHLRLEHPFSSYGDRDKKTFCLRILTKAFIDGLPGGMPANTKPEEFESILKFQNECLLKELSGKLGALTVSEIEFAFHEGVRGQSGPYFGMCPKTYNQFLTWFFNYDSRNEAWVRYMVGMDTLRFSEVPVKLTKESLIQSAKGAFEDYKNSGKLPFVPHAIYETIKELTGKETLIDKADWESIKSEAKKTLTERFKGKGAVPLCDLLKMENRTFEFEIKKIGLKRFFDSLITNNKTLEI